MLTVAQIVTRDVAGPRHRVWAPSISTRPCCHDGEAINSKCHMHAVDLPIVLAGCFARAALLGGWRDADGNHGTPWEKVAHCTGSLDRQGPSVLPLP